MNIPLLQNKSTLVGFYVYHINPSGLFNDKSSLCIYIKYIWFGLVLLHINCCRLFNSESSFYIYIRYIRVGVQRFYGISIVVGYLMPNPLYIYKSNIFELGCNGFMAYQPL